MRTFFYKLCRLIYARTGSFSEIIFSLPFLALAILVQWFVRRNIHKRLYGEKFKLIRRKSRLNEMIQLLLYCWIVEVAFVALTPTEFWYGVWDNIISGEYLNFRIWRFTLTTPDFVPFVLKCAINGDWDFMIRFADHFVPHCIINIAFFTPLGLAFPFISKSNSFSKTVVVGLLCSFIIEFLQCFIGRDSSADDLICNSLGTVVGYLLYLLIKKLFPKFVENGKKKANEVWLETINVEHKTSGKTSI